MDKKKTQEEEKDKRLQNVWFNYITPAYTEYGKQNDDSSKNVPDYFVPDIENCDKKCNAAIYEAMLLSLALAPPDILLKHNDCHKKC